MSRSSYTSSDWMNAAYLCLNSVKLRL
jgi:hypothetical protein